MFANRALVSTACGYTPSLSSGVLSACHNLWSQVILYPTAISAVRLRTAETQGDDLVDFSLEMGRWVSDKKGVL